MKPLTFLIPLLLFSSLWGQEEEQYDTTQWDATQFQTENAPPPFYPFSISGNYVNVSPASFRSPNLAFSDLKYTQSDIAFAYTLPFSEICGLIFGAGWVGTIVDMKENPEFNETDFNYLNLSVGVFSRAFPDWTWTVTLSAFFDTEEFSLIDYTLYQGVIWGRYTLCKSFEFDVGLILESGLHKEKIWPILGIVYQPSKKWHINLVYPINVAVEYDFNECFTAAASIRFLRNRHRVAKDEPNPMGIFEYISTGGEFDLSYKPKKWASIKGYLGSTFGGDLKVSNRNNHHIIHYKFKDSFYAGVSALLSF